MPDLPAIVCRACGRRLNASDAVAQAGPGHTYWYCRDTDGCRDHMEAR